MFRLDPHRKRYDCWKGEKARREIVDWLAARGPREWHAAAEIWNWDGGVDILAMILEQPECGRATAQLVFSRAEASYYVSAPDTFAQGKEDPGSVFNMILDMLARWRDGFYTVGNYALPSDDYDNWPNIVIDYQLAVIEKWDRDPALMLPRDFMRLAPGGRIDFDGIQATMPNSMQP